MAPAFTIRQRARSSRAANRTSFLRLSALVPALAFLAACAGDTPMSPKGAAIGGPNHSVTDITTSPILWDQSAYEGGHAHARDAGKFGDDFIVPSGSTWEIKEILLTGSLSQTIVNNEIVDMPLTIQIYTDAGGVPGTPIRTDALAPVAKEPNAVDRSDYLFRLSSPLSLSAGTYWLVVSMPDGGEFTWVTSSSHFGNPSVGTGLDGTGWYPQNQPQQFDFIFVLYSTGLTPAGAAQSLQSTLTGFGLDAGTFTSLNAKLRALRAAIDAGDTAGACSALRDFINQVNALAGKKLTVSQAATLLTAANDLKQLLGC